jgi:hypothetical protein
VQYIDDITGVHEENLNDTKGHGKQYQASEKIGLNLPVFLREKENAQENTLNYPQENKDGKKIYPVRHSIH